MYLSSDNGESKGVTRQYIAWPGNAVYTTQL